MNNPIGVALDQLTGATLYVSDTANHIIRAVVLANASTTTVAGSGAIGHADGIGTSSSFNGLRGGWWPRAQIIGSDVL